MVVTLEEEEEEEEEGGRREEEGGGVDMVMVSDPKENLPRRFCSLEPTIYITKKGAVWCRHNSPRITAHRVVGSKEAAYQAPKPYSAMKDP